MISHKIPRWLVKVLLQPSKLASKLWKLIGKLFQASRDLYKNSLKMQFTTQLKGTFEKFPIKWSIELLP